ncbi:MAG: diguanylate cyclase [Desulfobacterales bacterium]|nr:diguanylate cyclase [Desulfobacterales bacterium]
MKVSINGESCWQIIDTLSQGLIVLDRNLRIQYWNRWMAQHANMDLASVVGRPILEIFPGLKEKGFLWKVNTVFSLGNFAFFSQRLHQSVFPLAASRYLEAGFEQMQQNIVIAPLRGTGGKVERVAVSVIDNTDAAIYRKRLEETTGQLQRAVRIDYLTGIANRLHLFERLKEELARHLRSGEPLSLAILDLDHFKRVNDAHGHLCGDHVLAETAHLLAGQLRAYDLIGRYGGEEFCIVLPRTDMDTACSVLDRLRVKIAAHEFVHKLVRLAISVSIGVASTQHRERIDSQDLLRDADEALYRAKNAGRNRMECFVPGPPGSMSPVSPNRGATG